MLDETLDARTWSGLEYLESLSGPGAIAEMVESFRRDAPDRMVRMAAALEAGDLPLLARLAHDLKSNSAAIGALRLSALGGRIETSVRDAAPETLAQWLRDADTLLAGVMAALAEKVKLYSE